MSVSLFGFMSAFSFVLFSLSIEGECKLSHSPLVRCTERELIGRAANRTPASQPSLAQSTPVVFTWHWCHCSRLVQENLGLICHIYTHLAYLSYRTHETLSPLKCCPKGSR